MRSNQLLRAAAMVSFIAPVLATIMTLLIRGSVTAPESFAAMGVTLVSVCFLGLVLAVVVIWNRALIREGSSVRRALIGAAANGAFLLVLGVAAL